jgi:hypothetical protein
MKEFKKIDNKFVCEECNKISETRLGIGIHIGKSHNGKEYFDKWCKEEKDNKCKICNKETQFNSLISGYKNFCCKKHDEEWNHIQIFKSIEKKYGVKCALQIKEVKEIIKQTKKEKYNDENYNNRKKYKETCQKRFGVENPFQSSKIKEKSKETLLKNYEVEYPSKSKEIRKKVSHTKLKIYGNENYNNREKAKQTCIKEYGVKSPMQNTKICEKQQKRALTLKPFLDTNIWYQGTLELDFLDKHYDRFLDIQRGPSIKYVFEGKNKVYHPDFFIPYLNLIIEIKSSYYYKKYKEVCDAKHQATLASGFNYIMIVDKDYTKFNNLLNK